MVCIGKSERKKQYLYCFFIVLLCPTEIIQMACSEHWERGKVEFSQFN